MPLPVPYCRVSSPVPDSTALNGKECSGFGHRFAVHAGNCITLNGLLPRLRRGGRHGWRVSGERLAGNGER
jgi:hypothetical protein